MPESKRELRCSLSSLKVPREEVRAGLPTLPTDICGHTSQLGGSWDTAGCFAASCFCCCCCSVAKLCPALCDCIDCMQHTRLLCLPPFPGVCSKSRPLSQWCCLTISSSAAPFSFCLQSFPASGSFPMSQLFTSDDQSIGASASCFY